MIAAYRNDQIRELEQLAIKKGMDEYQLMQNAARFALTILLDRWPNAKKITICTGKGNNGGDGYELAKLATDKGLDVSICAAIDPEAVTSTAAKEAISGCRALNVPINLYNYDTILSADIIVDALLGSGLSGDVTEPYSNIISAINSQENPVIALDVPSGLDVNTGCVKGYAVRADVTATFIGHKQGLFTRSAPTCCGELIVNNLAISPAVFAQITPAAEVLTWEQIKTLLPRRRRDAHKGNYGHVLVVGGDYGMGGAVRMAAEAAMRVGAGLVTVATRPEHVPVVSGTRPELMCHQVAEARELIPLLDRATIAIIGPGLGKTPWAESLLEQVLATNIPKLLDADALNLLSHNPQKRNDWILTPHPGEAGRLLGIGCQDLQQDRFKSVAMLQQKYGGIAVLKGVGTLIKSDDSIIRICPAGNPGMATGGMGDVLSGIIGGLMAQQLSLFSAAEAGVFIHAKAADRAADEGGERGLLATDLLSHLRHLVNPDWLI